MSHKIVPLATYRSILFALIGLTVLTVVMAPPVTGIDLGFMNAVVAIAIASVKAFLVGAYFMHLKYDDKLFTLSMFVSVFFLVLLFGFAIMDIYTRVPESSPL
jgi:cytochrome c oxidase subunit 4